MRRRRHILLILCLILTPAFASESEKDRVSRITKKLVCTCGCANIIVASCDCGHAAEMRKEVADLVKAGTSDTLIFAAFEKKYGKAVLGAPKAEGFNILAWVLPFLGLGLGAVIVVTVVKRLRRRDDEAVVEPEPEIDEKYRRMLEEELEE